MVIKENEKEFLAFENSLEALSKLSYDFYSKKDFEEQVKSLNKDKEILKERAKLFTISPESLNLRFNL